MPNIWELSATELAEQIRQRSISATEAAAAALARLDAVNPRLNAVVMHRPDEVMDRARAVDASLARGETPGLLAGVPVTIKVNVDQAGFATTNGVRLQRDVIATSNSPVVDNFLKAGAVLLGRTNTPAFSYRWFTDNRLHGETFNPRNRGLTPGGSSGGAAASVAAGIGHIAHGTDIAGSIRYPAYACGVHGLRPSLGRVAAFNATAPERTIGGQITAVSGPIARTVADLSLALEVLAGQDSRDPWWMPAPLSGPDLPKRAAFCLRPDGMDTAPEIITALHEAADRLRDAGWDVTEVDELPPIRTACEAQITLWLGDGYDAMVEAAEREGDAGAIAVLAGQASLARSITLQSFSHALKLRATVIRAWQLFLDRYPVVLLPVSAELAFEAHLDLKDAESYARVWNAQAPMIGLAITGLPALTLTMDASGPSPIGIQIVAARFREDVCLEAGRLIEARGAPIPIAMPD